MTDRQLKGLILFLLESIIIQERRMITQDFAELFNEFIYEQYEKSNPTLSIIFNLELLGEFVQNKYDILTLQQIMQLIYPNQGLENYTKLVEEIGIEDDKKINELALLFSEYYNEIIKLSHDNNQIWYPKGYSRIKQ